MSASRYLNARGYVLDILKAIDGTKLYYHNMKHTLFVHDAAKKICEAEGIKGRKRELILVAALFHDTGYLVRYDKNEPFGAMICETALAGMGYTAEEIRFTKRLILATSMPQRPKNRYEQILCDADLATLGSSRYFSQAEALRRELGVSGNEWKSREISFLKGHKYFTSGATDIYGPTKEKNIRRLEILAAKGNA
ncbi:MAG: HD domain-containing protein [Candidatus Micrarchaeota archaeon]|nr:HD domain-containing protein [Candidatus Micrarchaeota archaeon]